VQEQSFLAQTCTGAMIMLCFSRTGLHPTPYKPLVPHYACSGEFRR
jgi:hypothetical protein